MRRLPDLFNKHPRAVGETYLQHLRTALTFSRKLVIGGVACAIHGMFPWLFEKVASDTVRELHKRMRYRMDDLLDLEEYRSYVRVKGTNRSGLFVGMQGELYKVRFKMDEVGVYTAEELKYEGTPGSDCPYLSDYGIYE